MPQPGHMRANPTGLVPTKSSRQLSKSTYQATEKLTTMSDFESLGHRNRGNQNRTVSPNMWPSHSFTEQPVSSPSLKKDQKLQKRNTKMPQVNSINRPMQRIEKCCKLTQNTIAVGTGSKISTRNTTTMHLKPGPIQETRRAGKRGKININPDGKLACFFCTTLIPDGGGVVWCVCGEGGGRRGGEEGVCVVVVVVVVVRTLRNAQVSVHLCAQMQLIKKASTIVLASSAGLSSRNPLRL